MKKVTYIVENRETRTADFISDTGYSKLKDAKEYFNKLIEDKKLYKGETISLLRQVCLYEKGEFVELLEERLLKEVNC